MNYNHAPIAELEAADELSWEQVYEILSTRAQRTESASARRAARWCEAHPEYAPKAARKTQPKPAPKPAGVGSRGGDPAKAARATYANSFGARGTAAWWGAYRSVEAKALAHA